jgi:hypothetical protein
MASTYDNTNSGILARNDRKTTDKHPDFSGSLNVAGTDYWLSGWVNEGRAGSKMEGKKYFSLKVTPKDAPASSAPRSYAESGIISDDIPF